MVNCLFCSAAMCGVYDAEQALHTPHASYTQPSYTANGLAVPQSAGYEV